MAVREVKRYPDAVLKRPADPAGPVTRALQELLADLVLVDGDPTRDLAVMLKPKAVWARGAPVAS